MNTVRRIIGLFQDSPNYGRDRANLLSGFTIGTAGLLLNAAVMMLLLPLMVDAGGSEDFRTLTENVEFGQLLALILLGGATAFATLLIPLRLVTVFWGPRIGGYFDQIVLSGISPLRFVIGKATSQNLFLGLILFLLVPYFVLSLTLGGVKLGFFVAGLFLVWLYCMALSLVTLWVSLYFNELLAAILVAAGAATLIGLGCIPMPFQPFVLTPAPALLHPVYTSIPYFDGRVSTEFLPLFFSCAACMATVSCLSLFAIYVGPLYGIIRENSTFGEVVRTGDSKRKRWFRLRLHIQRPSEIAFFYENRSDTFRRFEALIRWGIGLAGMVLLSAVAYATFIYLVIKYQANTGPPWRWSYPFHATTLTIHGVGLVLAAFLFSHAKNSTLMRLPFYRGVTTEVSRLDTRAFLIFLLISTVAAIFTPLGFEHYVATPLQHTIFPDLMFGDSGRTVNFARAALEGSLMISFAGLVVYACHRFACLLTWVKSPAFLGIAGLYIGAVCMVPFFVGMIVIEIEELRRIQLLADWAPTISLVSPVTVVGILFNELSSRFPRDATTIPFYVFHSMLLVLAMVGIRRKENMLRSAYLSPLTRKANG